MEDVEADDTDQGERQGKEDEGSVIHDEDDVGSQPEEAGHVEANLEGEAVHGGECNAGDSTETEGLQGSSHLTQLEQVDGDTPHNHHWYPPVPDSEEDPPLLAGRQSKGSKDISDLNLGAVTWLHHCMI